MKNDKIIPGLILVFIGAAFLLNNFGYIHFHWLNIIHLWPLFLVMAGINLVFAHNHTAWATILKISVLIAGFAFILFGDFGNRFRLWPHFNYSYNDDGDDNNDDDSDSTGNAGTIKMAALNAPYKADIKHVQLNIHGGGSTYTLNDETSQLFEANVSHGHDRYSLLQHQDDSTCVLDFNMKNHNQFHFGSEKNVAVFRLNPNPDWAIDVETGATQLDFDLSKFKVSELKLHGGAASFNVKMGQPLAITDIDISTGVSSVEVMIPHNAACSIESNSGLSSNNYPPNFITTDDNLHETPGYSAAKNKINIHIKGGLSDFKVRTY